jgi:hypothetical protein
LFIIYVNGIEKYFLHCLFLLAFYAGPYNSVRATLEGWRTTIRAEIAAEYKDSTNLARQQQAQEEERGQHLSAEDELVWARERFRADCAARAIRTYLEASVPAHDGPIPKVRNTPVGPAGPIPPLDTKLLVTSKVYYSPSLCLRPALTQFC